jgi:DNA-directed RNA polymerase specialized sigma24 family protein
MDDLRDLPDLLARFRADDEGARTKVYLMFVKRVEAWMRRGFPLRSGKRVPGLRNDDDHAEAVQEVFLRAFEDQARLGYDGSVTYWTYLSAIARNVASDYYRRRHRRPRPSPRAESGAKRPAIAG